LYGCRRRTVNQGIARPYRIRQERPLQHFERFTTSDSLVMLVDHQTMTIDWVKSLPKATTIASCRVLARMALTYGMPLVLTTTMEDYVGPTIPDVADLAPDAFARRFKRGGELSCWDAADLREGVEAMARPNIILAGLTTDICLFWAAVDAQKLGYKVMVVADACGTMTALGDTLTMAEEIISKL
jgi:nicotinamidase-related amidase